MTATSESKVFNERDYFDDCLCEGVDETESDWDAEIGRRLQQVVNGEVELVPGDVVFRHVREVLGEVRRERERVHA